MLEARAATAELPSRGGDHPCPGREASNACTRLGAGLQDSEKAHQYSVPLGRCECLHPFVWKDTSD